MALINKVLPGFVATMWMQDDAVPTPLTPTQLNTWTDVEAIIGTSAGGTGTAGMQIPIEVVPAFGSDDAFAAYSIAGARTGAKITTQNQPTSMTITAAYNSADPALLQIVADGNSGTVIRTYVVSWTDGTDTGAFAFNGRVGGIHWDMAPSAESKLIFTVHPVGGDNFGQSNS